MSFTALCMPRSPEPAEIQSALHFVDEPRGSERSQLTPWQQYAQVLLLTNEMMFVD